MSIRTTISVVAVALAALLVAVLAPTGAAAHGGAPHAHAAKLTNGAIDISKTADVVTAEIRAQTPVAPDRQADTECGDRGCCSAGHCSGCGTALAPASWVCLDLPSELLLLNPVSARPSSLAREGPPRPPKFFA